MTLTDAEIRTAEERMRERLETHTRAMSARYDAHARRIVVTLSNGLDLGVPVDLAQGLAGAETEDLAEIEITPAGLGLHWPRLDADLYLPALMEGIIGSRQWMARVMGRVGGEATTVAKQAASRANGKRGGRPRKVNARRADAAVAPYRKELEALCRQYRVRRLSLFGSAVRDDFDPKSSDLDLAVEFGSPEGLSPAHQYFDFKAGLERLFGRTVDLVELSGMPDTRLKRIIEKTKLPVYAEAA